jgi:hypothetical protein
MGNMRKITRKQAVSNLQCLFDNFFKTYFRAPKEAIDETLDNTRFYEQKEKLKKAVYSAEYSSILGQLDSESFRKYYEKVGEFAKAYKIDMRLFTEETPAVIEDINDVLKESPNIAEKLDLINGFTDEELRTERISFGTKTALIESILDSWFVGDDKEQGINRMLMSLTVDDRLAFVNKIGTDRKFLNRLIQCVNGREKDEMLAVLGEIFIGTGLANEGTDTVIDNGQSDKIEASYNNGRVSITVLQEQGMGARDYRMTPKARYTVNALENISMYYDGRLINVPALLLLNSWSNSMAEPEGLFYNYRNEDIDWNTLSDEKKDEYFYKFVAHYLPSGFVEAFGNPIQIIIMSCITILTGGLFAELQAALATAGIVMTAIDAKNAIGGLIQANNQKEAARTMHEAKNAAKVMARCIAKLTLDAINVICTVAGYLKGKKKIQRKEDIDNFHLLSNENKESVFEALSNKELYEMVQRNPKYDWITKNYDLITRENIKDIVILRKDGSLNLDWPKYAGLKLESVKSIGNMKGKVYVSRSGSEGGNTLGYGDSIESWYASNSQRSIPSSNSKIRTGVMDVDKYKKVIEIINSNIDDDVKGLLLQKKLKISEDISDLLIRSYYEWNGKRFEVFGTDGIVDGLQSVNISIDSSYGFSGNISPWQIGGLNMEGGSGQLNTSFSWELLVNSGIIDNVGEVTIK